RRLAASRLGRWMIGATAPRWGERNATWRRREPLGIIAGTLPLGLGWMTGRLPGLSDGVVRVEETLVEGMAQQVTVPVTHSALIASNELAPRPRGCGGSARWRLRVDRVLPPCYRGPSRRHGFRAADRRMAC